jgi:hypothetical protein
MKRFVAFSIALLGLTSGLTGGLTIPASAHVGSPDVFLDGHAGPYRLFVTVRVPQVIPGIAEIEIRSESNDVREIRVAPMQLTGPGSQYAPVPDVAQRSKTDPQFFTGSLWLMEFGSLQVRIDADGARGPGELSVPVPATAQRTLPMSRFLGIFLAALTLVLLFGLISIVAAAVREGNLEPGAAATPATSRRARVAATVAAVVVFGLLLIGGEWWKSEASRYASHIYTPPELQATMVDTKIDYKDPDAPGGRLLLREGSAHIAAGNPRRDAEASNLDDLIPDHNHLMHFFMIRTPAMDSFWHLHPDPEARGEGGGFSVRLPAAPAGHYELFADVVLRSGFPVTMVGQIDLPESSGAPLTGDDSGIVADPISAEEADTRQSALPDGGQMIWERDTTPLASNIPRMFRFRVLDRDGKPANDLEPYMGMAAHAEIVRSDGSVFAHVHPSGSASMAAMEIAQAGMPMGDMKMSATKMRPVKMTEDHVDPEISFPYGFPKLGLYRIFVQVKRSGKIQTGVFDATVK